VKYASKEDFIERICKLCEKTTTILR